MKNELHPRNRHRNRYDFAKLIKHSPELALFVTENPYGDESIDFSNPAAVLALNKAILIESYGVSHWGIPEGYLCPPIPGRADYIHRVADLLAFSNDEVVPQGSSIRALDIGVGASCIYPIIGHAEYGWSFVGTDIDTVALGSAKKIVQANPDLKKSVELRLQDSPSDILKGVLHSDELFDVVICNPPFHASLEEAHAGSRRKWTNLGREKSIGKFGKAPVLNFGGQGSELWCEGGEVGFVRRIIEESTHIPEMCFVFSSLVSKETNLPAIYAALERTDVEDVVTLEMEQGQKKSRIVAWTYLDAAKIKEWRAKRWAKAKK